MTDPLTWLIIATLAIIAVTLGVVVDHQRRTIDRLAQDVDDLWDTGDTLDLDTEGEHHD